MSYWWVNQGDTYEFEREHGCIFASKISKSGREHEHHNAIMRLRPGDIIFHYARGKVMAVGKVKAEPREDRRPYEVPPTYLRTWGFLAEVDYHPLREPIARDDIPLEMRSRESDGPFTLLGTLKQQYLNRVSSEFAHGLVKLFASRLSDIILGILDGAEPAHARASRVEMRKP